MTPQELQLKIEKKENDIQKIEKRIAKWIEGMNDDAKELLSRCEVTYDDPTYKSTFQEYLQYKVSHDSDPTVFRQDYQSKGPNFQEAYSAYRDLAEAKFTLSKYKEKLAKMQSFEQEERIPVIWEFLQNWRADAYEFFVENSEEYGKLMKGFEDALEEFKNSGYYKSLTSNGRKNDAYYEWKNKYFRNIHSLTKEIYLGNGRYDEVKLNKLLDKDVDAKYKDFIARIQDKAGKIVDATDLRISGNGAINGIVIGESNKVKVETIMAGGYNQDVIVNVKHGQILHYRVLVNIIK